MCGTDSSCERVILIIQLIDLHKIPFHAGLYTFTDENFCGLIIKAVHCP